MKALSRKGYENYLKAYNKKLDTFTKKGFKFYDDNGVYSFTEWKNQYKAMRNDRLDLVKAGQAKSVGNINQYLVAGQAYSESLSQAKKIQIALKNINKDLNISSIRAGNTPWESISELYDSLKDLGFTGTSAKKWISFNLFESM